MQPMHKATGAGYRQGVPKTERKRCDTCAHHRPGHKQHGLTCHLYGFSCKTHGVCDFWLIRPSQMQGGTPCTAR